MAQIKDIPEQYLEIVQNRWSLIKKKTAKTQKSNAKKALMDALDCHCYGHQASLVKEEEEEEELENVMKRLTVTEIDTENCLMKNISMPAAMPKLIGEPPVPSAIAKVWDVLEQKSIEINDVEMPNMETYPHMCDWSPAYSNEFVPDELTLRFVPSFDGDQHGVNAFLAELMNSFDQEEWKRKYVYLGEAFDELVGYFKESTDPNNPLKLLLTKDKELVKDIDQEMVIYHLISAALPELGFGPEKMKERHEAFQEDFHGKVRPLEYMPSIDEAELFERVYSADEALGWHRLSFCRRCFKYDCAFHDRYTSSFRPVKEDLSIAKVCGPKCFLNIEGIRKEDYQLIGPNKGYTPIPLCQVRTDHWSNSEQTLVNVLLQTFDNNFCSVAVTLGGGKTCAEVYVMAQELAKKFSVKPRPEPMDKKNKKRSIAKLKQTITVEKLANSAKKEDGDPLGRKYIPCDHVGRACDKKCICVVAGVYCEKYCNCSVDCPERFPGCSCTGNCTTKCSCFNAARECDPDLCRSCEAGSLEKDVCSIRCNNVNIQRGLKKRLLVGCSDVAGWGCFVNDTVEKGQFISEYCGEMISHDEAERRGVIYDKQKCSFLFNLNSEYAIDSMRKGNKIRFANHSEQPNCVPRVMFVNGDHRIGIYALRHIDKMEELLLDYRYGKDHKLKFVNAEKKKM